ncbi:AraC family ligand binding domain-containing protein [Pedobacter steynii]
MFLLFPGVWHRYKPHPKYGWEEYWVGFNGTYPDELIKKEYLLPRIHLLMLALMKICFSFFIHLLKLLPQQK